MFVSVFSKLLAVAAMMLAANSVATHSTTRQPLTIRGQAAVADTCVGIHCSHGDNVRAPGGGDGGGGTGTGGQQARP